MKLSLNIVGLTHNDIQENLLDYARSARGKRLKLVPDPQNIYDPMAMKAYDATLFVGYVAAQDLEDAKALLAASGKKVLSAICTGYNAKEDGHSGIYLTAVAHAVVEGEKEILHHAVMGGDASNGAKGAERRSVMPWANELEFVGGKILNLDAGGDRLPMPELLCKAYESVYDDSIYGEWHYSGPVFPIERLDRIDDCTDMLEDSLGELLSIDGELESDACLLRQEVEGYLMDFFENHRFDFSREMMQTRKHIQTLLSLVSDTAFQKDQERLLSEMGYLTSSGYREEAAHVFFVDTPIELLKRKMGNYDYTDRLDEVERELEAFPFDLYRKFKADPVDFLREVFYKRVPRREMKKLLSGIIFMVMNRRVSDVKRWGKHDDRTALQEMKELRHIKVYQVGMSEEEKAERARVCIRKMAVELAKSGYGWMIKSQADWYVVQRVLVDVELIDIRDHARFSAYLAEVLSQGGVGEDDSSDGGGASDEKKSSDGKASSGVKEPSGAKARPRIPLCKKKDLDQASVEVFEKTSPKEWAHLSDDELGGVQQAKFNHYCDIVEAMQRLL